MDTVNTSTSYGQCRCCLAKGYHRDVMKEYHFKGIREVYCDIFMECFNLYLSTNTCISNLICASCVRRLRDASSFRMMVVSTERQLLDSFDDKQTVFVNVPNEHSVEMDVKIERETDLKEEESDAENDRDWESEYEMDSPCNSDTIFATNNNRKEDLVEGEAELLARFQRDTLRLSTRETLYNTCRGYVRHLDSLKGRVITTKTIEKMMRETDRKRNSNKTKSIYVTEKLAHVLNASTLIEFSNLTPFKAKTRSGFPCFYCREIFENLPALRDHQTREHSKSNIVKVLNKCAAESLVVYADVTDLKCTICYEKIANLNELKSHLTKEHQKKLHADFTDRVIPFKLAENFVCQTCGFSFETFGSVERHMNVHYRNYVCEECGAGFVTKRRLKVHLYSLHIGGSFPCRACKKVFNTHHKYKTHVDAVHRMLKKNKCPKCPERFTDYFRRQKHMVEAHGVAPLQYRCNVCDKAFNRRYHLSCHMKRSHLDEKDKQCELCTYKCYTNSELRVHMVKHNSERVYECSVCKKSYARKKTLKEHMRIHNNDRRFSCAVCGQAFVQNCSLKGHMKTHHLEYAIGMHG